MSTLKLIWRSKQNNLFSVSVALALFVVLDFDGLVKVLPVQLGALRSFMLGFIAVGSLMVSLLVWLSAREAQRLLEANLLDASSLGGGIDLKVIQK